MSKEAVEQVIGRLFVDESFRERMANDADGALEGFDLTPEERKDLSEAPLSAVDEAANLLDQRISKGKSWN